MIHRVSVTDDPLTIKEKLLLSMDNCKELLLSILFVYFKEPSFNDEGESKFFIAQFVQFRELITVKSSPSIGFRLI